ncbi:MAG: hypothetical protein U0822_08460 [Anaerolineae bacterium]
MAPFQTQHLFVLVGTNPLPNYVAAKLLLAPAISSAPQHKPHLYLVHTKRTDPVADRLAKLFPDVVTKVPVDENNAADIYKAITPHVHSGSIGVNYTGGTKAMAVHTYQALRKLRKDDVICSYLDARTLSIQIDHPPNPSTCISIELAETVRLETLLQMHGHALHPDYAPPLEKPLQLGVARVMLDINREDWRTWCDKDALRPASGADIKKENKLRPVKLPTAWPDLAAQWPGCASVGDLAVKWKRSPREVAKWLDGGWLEDYTLAAVQAVAPSCHVHYSAANVWICAVSNEGHPTPALREFELDVAAIRGYQLFVLSCTTDSSKGRLKLKLFEAYARARQIGGDEARAALVCYAPKDEPDKKGNDPKRSPQTIQREIEDEWDARGLVRVFGEEHMPNLGEHLREWFQTQANRGGK